MNERSRREDTGHRLRVLITVLGLDQHEAGALAVARILRDRGFEVIYTGRFNLPETITSVALEEDVDAVGVSAHSWEFLSYAGELVEALNRLDPPIPLLVGGSVVTESDRDEVLKAGVSAVVSATATEEEIAGTFLELADRHRSAAG